MMRVLYIISKYITFPGSLLRCFWEQFMCKVTKVPVESNKCLSVDEMCGHIEHEIIRGKSKSFWNAFIPGLIVFIAGLIFFIAPAINLFYINIAGGVQKIIMYVLLYLALSLFNNIFPSIEDAMVMMEQYKKFKLPLKILFGPGAGIMYVGAFAEKYCITTLTNIILAVVIIVFHC